MLSLKLSRVKEFSSMPLSKKAARSLLELNERPRKSNGGLDRQIQ